MKREVNGHSPSTSASRSPASSSSSSHASSSTSSADGLDSSPDSSNMASSVLDVEQQDEMRYGGKEMAGALSEALQGKRTRSSEPGDAELHVRGGSPTSSPSAADRDTSRTKSKGKRRAAPSRSSGDGLVERDIMGAYPRPAQQQAQHPHVDIVSYPPASLLRLLAALLEQIAHANDALNLRSTSPSTSSTHLHERDSSETDAEAAFRNGRFDAAPLNSPATPCSRSSSQENLDSPFPVTPGADLLTQVPGGPGAGVQGFMPSLGGMHSPLPLARRRGSSFLKNKSGAPPLASTPSSSSPAASTSTSFPRNEETASEVPLTSLLTASSNALSSPTSSLCFHARNVPAITIEAYLLRILKYCPTTNEVFLSLLVYFDRMARISLEAKRMALVKVAEGASGNGPDERFFAIDSFNVHRLLIAGVTVASKFFSDVFYTNSRYAKVGGLPLTELNQLELQFLLLNDFRLKIPLDELQRYADQLLLFWVGRNPPLVPTLSPAVPPQPPSLFSSTPTQSTSMAVDGTPNSSERRRPNSIRSQPSSSGTSVTSTITPGTPSTERASASEGEADDDDDADYDDYSREGMIVDRDDRMEED